MKKIPLLARAALCLLLTACSAAPAAAPVATTSAPPETSSPDQPPTIVALTVQAGLPTLVSTETATPTAGKTATEAPTENLESTPQATITETEAAETPAPSATGEPEDGPDASETPQSEPPTTESTAALGEEAPTPFTSVIEEAVVITSPGPASKVVSPLRIQAEARAEPGGQVQVEVLGEDGRVLVREIKQILGTYRAGFARLLMDLEFEIPGPAEEGRLKISVVDPTGRLTALNSIPLVLLSMGDADIYIPAGPAVQIRLGGPAPRTSVKGGMVQVNAIARLPRGAPVMARLIDAEGKELGSRLAGFHQGEGDVYEPLSVEVPYRVSEPTQALLVLWAGGSSLEDIIYLTSVSILLEP